MIPSMTTLSERIALRSHVALNLQGSGEIVEIGAFCGASAVAIMQGIQDSRHYRKLHVYDAFRFPKNDLERTYRSLVPHLDGESFRPAFDFATRAWAKNLVAHEGDASLEHWTEDHIEFMHIDCSISMAFHTSIALEFYPSMVVGASIAHQDYFYERAPFIAQLMTRLEPWFKKFFAVETTQYFRCYAKPSRAELLEALA